LKLRSRILACASSLLLLSGCSWNLGKTLDDVAGGGGGSSGGGGPTALVVGDEPYAVQVGANVLSQGGSAVDAATAMYFALAVTYPVAAGLGGGGICLVHNGSQTVEYDFLARDSSGGGAYAVPGNVRGFAMMQGTYGVLPWARDIAPAEGYAAAGFPISRALSTRIASTLDVIRLDAALAAEFLDETGAVKAPGTTVNNPDLAQTLAAIRLGGPKAFYGGQLGARILAYSGAQGGSINVAEFARYPVLQSQPQAIQIGGQYVYFPNANTGAGAFGAALYGTLKRTQETATGEGDLQASIVVSVKQALTRFGIANLPQDLGATGFAVVDARGQAVSCAVTMNGPFGSGHNAEGTGVTLARAPSSGDAGLSAAFLAPVIATDGSGNITLAAAGSGGPNATASVGYAIAKLGRGDALLNRQDLRSTGVAPFDTINAIVCQNGTCVALPDPGANGLGAVGGTTDK